MKKKEVDHLFCSAILSRDPEALEKILNTYPIYEMKKRPISDELYRTLLHTVAERLLWNVDDATVCHSLEILLKKGADPNIMNEGGLVPLFFASKTASLPTIELLLKYGARWDVYDQTPPKYRSPRFMGGKNLISFMFYGTCGRCYSAHPDKMKPVIQFLIKKGVSILEPDNEGLNALHFALYDTLPGYIPGRNEAAEKLFEYLLDEAVIQSGFTRQKILRDMAFDLIKVQNTNFVNLFREADLPVDTTDEKGRSLLMVACQWNRKDIVKILVQKGADLEQKDPQGLTALSYIIDHFHVGADYSGMVTSTSNDTLQILLEAGANTDVKNEYGLSFFEWVIKIDVSKQWNQRYIFEHIIYLPEEIIRSETDKVLLALLNHWQIKKGAEEELILRARRNLRNGVAINDIKDEGDKNLLMAAVTFPGFSRWLMLFLKLGVDLNACDKEGKTVLDLYSELPAEYQTID